jgi:hypothetical protein
VPPPDNVCDIRLHLVEEVSIIRHSPARVHIHLHIHLGYGTA